MSEIEHWISRHEHELHELATRTATQGETVEMLATLVLAGWTDTAIYDQLREITLSHDGQRSPLEHTPELIGAIRRLVAAS
jgi:hypothetical protein